jgi:hypothetical protein
VRRLYKLFRVKGLRYIRQGHSKLTKFQVAATCDFGSLILHMQNFIKIFEGQNLISLVENLVVFVRYTRICFFFN